MSTETARGGQEAILAWNADLRDFDPESEAAWHSHGRAIAVRNLVISCVCLSLAFVVWFFWSTIVVYINNVGFDLTTGQLFTLMSIPMLTGATLRIVYSFVIPFFGGRVWTALSTASLLVPSIGIGVVLQDPDTSFLTLCVLAGFCGLGGGNFASSMANIQLFFPKRLQGLALGANAGLGNLGVSFLQLAGPFALGFALYEPVTGPALALVPEGAVGAFLQNVAFIWVLPIVAATLAAWFGMNRLASASYSLREQAGAFRSKHMYILTCLYVMSFGSFVGFSALFPLISNMYFPTSGAENVVFLGPMIGSLIRPLGGWVSDRWGGARVTFWTTVVKIAAALGVIYFLPSSSRSFLGFFLTFMVVFLMSGVANASIFKMVPVLFPASEAGAVLGLSSAIASYGAYLIPFSFSLSLERFDTVVVALWWIVAFYLFCTALLWWHYIRAGSETRC